ncbi:hypothetical protein LAZ67_7001543 [Cordylochernes scorpioides]|uniref:RNA-directed DNA polymerase n=1 Tax=Cordylochernes scorpioides TaxID=51811 RepID=A0ABY6KMD5_9ARAC|nr:hypothetical protein LAZ67_7001543 [Cordylochernes scorpioides]
MGKLAIPLTIGQISRKEYFHVVNAPLPFGILSINSLHKFRLTIDFNKCTILQLGAPLSTLSYHFNHVSNVCTYWQCQAMSQKIFPTSQLSAYDNHCVHSLRKPHLSTCPFFTKANCPFYMPSNNQTTTTSTYEPAQNAPTQRDNSHTKNIGDHTPLHNSHMTNPHNELDTHTNTQQNPLPHAYYNTTPNTHYTPQFTTLLQRYTHIFSQDKFNVPCLRIPPVKIPTNSEKIITIRPYRVPICDQQEIRNQIQQMLENGIIEQSFSPFSSPVTLVTKRDKTKRFCIDYRKVNELINSDVHPLPRIEDILDRLAQAKYFSTADISSAYWQVPIHPDSRPLLAFATFEGLYQPTRLPFGLKTSPQIYERAISQVLQRHGLDCVAHYFDDFIIYSNTLEEHQNHLRQFFAFCEAEKLQLNFAKCEFFKQSINFLGYTITAGTITPLTRNTEIIHAIKQPHNRKTLQSFLGAVNVYNKFIPEYARLRAPLNNLLKKDVVWNWNEACQEAFIDLKGNLTQHPILHLYKEGLPCQVYCDASTLGIAGILKQVHPDGNVYPVQYFSRTLRPHEKNYSISELECLAIVESVEKFRIYLMGRKFTIFSDHHALQWLKTIKNPSGRLFRWSLRLSSYEYEVRYIKGKLQYEADLLSRNPFCGFLDATLIKTHQPPPSKESSLTIDRNGLHTVSRKGVTKIILPKPLIQQLLQTVHTQYNHPGISQMSRIISTQYYWQGMSKDIKQKVKTCPTCQLTKRPVGPTYGELSQPPESKEPFDLLSLDTIAGFAKYGNTKIYLHVVVDHFSRYAWAFPSKSTSTTTYQQVLKRVFQDGSPKRLLTDRAPAFTSPKFRSFLLNRNIHPLITTSNNPQANGLCERLNATLTGKLRLLHLENPKVAWTKLVKKVTLIYNKTPHSTTGFPPIYLMFGILPPEISNHNTPYPDIDKARKIAHTRTQNKHLQDKNTYDQRHKQPHFEVGDLVLVKLYHHPNTGKLAPYFTGPHTILEIISPNVVRIDRPNQPLQRDTDTIHANKLKLYTEKIHYISPPAVNTYHIKHNPNYTFPFKHLTPELFPTESLRFKPTSSEPFRHLDPAIFATRRFTSLFPDVKNCKPDNQLNPITPLPKDIKQENCEPTNHSNSTIHKVQANISESPVTKMWTNMGQYPIFHLILILCLLLLPYNCIPILFIKYLFIYAMPDQKIFELQEVVFNLGQAVFHCGQAILHCGQAILHCGQLADRIAAYGRIPRISYILSRSKQGSCQEYLKKGKIIKFEMTSKKDLKTLQKEEVVTGAKIDISFKEILPIFNPDTGLTYQEWRNLFERIVKLPPIVLRFCSLPLKKIQITPQSPWRNYCWFRDIISAYENDSNFLKSIVKGDETWCFQYDPKTKPQSAEWKSKNSPQAKKTRKLPSKIKTMLTTFFDSRGIIHKEFVPAGQTITGEYYLNVLKRLIARIRRIRPEYRDEDSWCLLHDNAPSHFSLIVRRFLAKNNVCVLNHPQYSPNLAPCDFYLFPKIKLKLKGCFFFMISRPSRELRRALWRRFLKVACKRHLIPY